MSEIKKENSSENLDNPEVMPSDIYEAKKANGGEEIREKINKFREYAESQLKLRYGIENLTTQEAVHLRNIVERLLPQYEREEELQRRGEMMPENGFEIEDEAAALWLLELYGIHRNQIPHMYVIKDNTDGSVREFPMETGKVLAEKTVEELNAAGRDVYLFSRIPDDWKEWLRRARENAHGAELKEKK